MICDIMSYFNKITLHPNSCCMNFVDSLIIYNMHKKDMKNGKPMSRYELPIRLGCKRDKFFLFFLVVVVGGGANP